LRSLREIVRNSGTLLLLDAGHRIVGLLRDDDQVALCPEPDKYKKRGGAVAPPLFDDPI
jgi:hypothetical protein